MRLVSYFLFICVCFCAKIYEKYAHDGMTHTDSILSANDSCQNRLDFLGSSLDQPLKIIVTSFCTIPDYANILADYLWSFSFLFLSCLSCTHTQKRILPQVSIEIDLAHSSDCRLLFIHCTHQAPLEFLDKTNLEYIDWITKDPSEKLHIRKVFQLYQSIKPTPNV